MMPGPSQPAQVATLEELLAARDAILRGRNVVEVSADGQTVKYGPGNLAALERRISDLSGPRISTVQIRPRKGW